MLSIPHTCGLTPPPPLSDAVREDTGWAADVVGPARVAELDWADESQYAAFDAPFDYVAAADCVYSEEAGEGPYRPAGSAAAAPAIERPSKALHAPTPPHTPYGWPVPHLLRVVLAMTNLRSTILITNEFRSQVWGGLACNNRCPRDRARVHACGHAC